MRHLRTILPSAVTVLCLSNLCWGAVNAWIEPANQTRLLGGMFSISIRADLPDPVLGWGLDISYDHSVLTMVGMPAIGPLWAGGFAPDGDGLAGLAFPTGAHGSSVLLATLNFSAAATGQTDLTLSVTPGDLKEGFALDPTGFAIASFQPGHLEVLPEPATALLFGIAALVLTRRKWS